MTGKEKSKEMPRNYSDDEIGGSELKMRFNFRFWKPADCIGGRVHFGPYYQHTHVLKDGYRSTTLQTLEQVRIKRDIGMII